MISKSRRQLKSETSQAKKLKAHFLKGQKSLVAKFYQILITVTKIIFALKSNENLNSYGFLGIQDFSYFLMQYLKNYCSKAKLPTTSFVALRQFLNFHLQNFS